MDVIRLILGFFRACILPRTRPRGARGVSISDASRPAGLAARFSAAAVDVALVLSLTFGVVGLGRIGNTYIPFELTFLLAWVAHAVFTTAWRQRTLGKWVLGVCPRGLGVLVE